MVIIRGNSRERYTRRLISKVNCWLESWTWPHSQAENSFRPFWLLTVWHTCELNTLLHYSLCILFDVDRRQVGVPISQE